LYAAIDARVVNMVAAGWITEVENLLKMVRVMLLRGRA
jgi:tRNA A37 N6-isopentenylltransferase MiaA